KARWGAPDLRQRGHASADRGGRGRAGDAGRLAVAVVSQRFAWPETRRADARDREESDHPRSVSSVWLEQLQHSLVGRSGRPLERIADRVREVIVADGDR